MPAFPCVTKNLGQKPRWRDPKDCSTLSADSSSAAGHGDSSWKPTLWLPVSPIQVQGPARSQQGCPGREEPRGRRVCEAGGSPGQVHTQELAVGTAPWGFWPSLFAKEELSAIRKANLGATLGNNHRRITLREKPHTV